MVSPAKKANGIPRVFGALAIGLQFGLSTVDIVQNLASSSVNVATLLEDVLCVLLVVLLNGVYYSRIARKPGDVLAETPAKIRRSSRSFSAREARVNPLLFSSKEGSRKAEMRSRFIAEIESGMERQPAAPSLSENTPLSKSWGPG